MSQFNVVVLIERETFATTFEPIQLNLGWHLKRLKSQGLPPYSFFWLMAVLKHFLFIIVKSASVVLKYERSCTNASYPQKNFTVFFYVSCLICTLNYLSELEFDWSGQSNLTVS